MAGTSLIAGGSILVGVLVLALKGAAWQITGSAAFFSDALETLVNIAASAMALWAVRVSARPPDSDHPYGHTKIELFTAIVEGGLIALAAAAILQHAWESWWDPGALDLPFQGLALNVAATVINGVWATVLLRAGRRHRSPALAADGRHLLTDVVTSTAIALGILLVVATGIHRLDPVLAALVALYVLSEGVRMVGGSVNVLMDAAPSPDVVARIKRLVSAHGTGAIEAHDFRSRYAGPMSFLEFHLVVPGDMSVADAHEICDRIEAALHAEMQGLLITIHVEPDHKAKHQGVLVL